MIKKQTFIFFLVVAAIIALFVAAEIVSEHMGYANFFEKWNEIVWHK